MQKLVRWIILGAIVVTLGALLIINMNTPKDHSDTVWDVNTTIGNLNAKNYYIQYTDLACPYCSVFSREIMNHEEEFRRGYIEGKDILYEVRVTDTLYEYSDVHSKMSRDSAEAIYCATDEGKFWDYYHAALSRLWDDYHSKGIGVSKTSAPITNLPNDYWLKIGESIGLGEKFEDCLSNHSMAIKVESNTERAQKLIGGGLPYFKFGSFSTNGFDNNWGWDYVKKYLDSGLKK